MGLNVTDYCHIAFIERWKIVFLPGFQKGRDIEAS
jgi:hypothetical protein